jgi:hypothetical protein
MLLLISNLAPKVAEIRGHENVVVTFQVFILFFSLTIKHILSGLVDEKILCFTLSVCLFVCSEW